MEPTVSSILTINYIKTRRHFSVTQTLQTEAINENKDIVHNHINMFIYTSINIGMKNAKAEENKSMSSRNNHAVCSDRNYSTKLTDY